MFLEFDDPLLGTVFISADCVAQVYIRSAEDDGYGNLYHEVLLTYKHGYEEMPDYFRIGYDALPNWEAGARKVLNNNAFIEESPPDA